MRGFPSIVDIEQAPRAFWGVLHRLELDRKNSRVLLYVQSRVQPNWEHIKGDSLVQDGVANPAVKSVAKAYSEIGKGQRLRFRLRANPTRKIDTKSAEDGGRRNGRRVPLQNLEKQIEWMARKADQHGFALEHVTIAAAGAGEYVRSRIKGSTFQGVLFEGQLVVREPEIFKEALASGIGPGKAFGFGLLSVGPV